MGSWIKSKVCFVSSQKSSRLMLGRWYRESCWNGKKKKKKLNMRNMHGVGFPNATYWVCTQTGTNADLQREPSQLVQRDAFDQTHGAVLLVFFVVKSKALHEEQGLHIEMQPIQTPVSISGEGFYYTSQSLSTVWSSVSECQQQHILSFCPFVSLRPSLQVSVFEVPVLEGEPLLLPLAPFFIVKVNVSALREQQSGKNH